MWEGENHKWEGQRFIRDTAVNAAVMPNSY